VGLTNYVSALGVDRDIRPTDGDPWYWRILGGRPRDQRFYTSLYNTLFYSAFAVPLGLCSSLAVALLLNVSFRGESVVRAIVYLPHVLGGVATIVIWSWLFNPRFGWLNQAIGLVYAGLDPLVRLVSESGTASWPLPRWLHSPTGCKPAVILMHAWTMGGSMLIFLAALRHVPTVLYDAANLDGAGAWHRFRFVTLPQITPAILLNATVGLIFAMQSFNEPYLLQNREQNDGLLFYVVNLYQAAFEPPYRLGHACALAWILCLVLCVLTLPLVLSSRRWAHYEDQP
jgi:multiple sugar transport system permease protein